MPGRSILPEPPGPRGTFLGGMLDLFRQDMLGYYEQIARDYGDIVGYRVGPKRFVILNHPDLIEKVLVTENKNFVKHFLLDLLQFSLGNGLLNSKGDYWLRQRRLMQPAFQRKRIEGYTGIMVAHSERLTQTFQNGETRNLHEDMMQLALGIVAEALLGMNVIENAPEVGESLELLMEDFSRRLQSLFKWPYWVPTPWNLKMRASRRVLDRIILKTIQQRREESNPRDDLVSVLLRAKDENDGSGMTDRQLRDELMTLFLAGHETTANTLTWTWYLLSQNPEAEARLHAELAEVLQANTPTAGDVPKLKYAEAVILEAMRIYPPVYAVGRRNLTEMEIGGYRIRKGTTVLMPQWLTHRDARWFSDPLTFRPERWQNGETDQLPKYAYYPFSGGPRVCIGNTFAMIEAVLILATLAQKFRFRVSPEAKVELWPSVTLRPRHGLPARVENRIA